MNLLKLFDKEWQIKFEDFIARNIDRINWNLLSSNPNITIEIIKKYPDKEWFWHNLSMNSNITMNVVEKYPDMQWRFSGLSRNYNINMNFVEKYVRKIDWGYLSKNSNITMEDSEKRKEKPFECSRGEKANE